MKASLRKSGEKTDTGGMPQEDGHREGSQAAQAPDRPEPPELDEAKKRPSLEP